MWKARIVAVLLRAILTLMSFLKVASLKLADWAVEDQIEDHIHEDDFDMDRADPNDPSIALTEIGLGEIGISCPACHEMAHEIMIGMGVVEHACDEDCPVDETEEAKMAVTSVGAILYPCGDSFFSPCLTDKVGRLLNAEEKGAISPNMLTGLISCEEHGVDYSAE